MGAICSLNVTVCARPRPMVTASRKIVLRFGGTGESPLVEDSTPIVTGLRRAGGGAVRVRRGTSLRGESRAGGRGPPSRHKLGGRSHRGMGPEGPWVGLGRYRGARGQLGILRRYGSWIRTPIVITEVGSTRALEPLELGPDWLSLRPQHLPVVLLVPDSRVNPISIAVIECISDLHLP